MMSDVLLLLQMVAKRLSVLSLITAVLLLLSHLWLYAVFAFIIMGGLICVDRIISEKGHSRAAENQRYYTLIVVTDEEWYEEEHVPFLEMDHVSLELHYQYEDIRRINPLIQLQAFPGFVLVETDDTKRIEKSLQNPALVTGNYAEVIRFLKQETTAEN
ncbi:hypothetical protein L3V65_01730 [Heyndrickxia coagulans]|uniref:hypothetical protein n=1 Tax=Heyndrickxia coagulans TaxID=1398 RepID=UPI001F1E25B1|nr:hypothetical protein [Heyndrickxia coagulans]UJZ87784.1 hypothetical protein L3V65_01730 [Heyndrickxia coagulans]